jgi:hypothetical protein
MRKLIFLLTVFILGNIHVFPQVTFVASSEKVVVVNQQFRVTYTLSTSNGEKGKDFRLAEIKDFNNLFGPIEQESHYSSYDLSGKVSSNDSYSYTYVLSAKKEGTFTLPPATIRVGNSEYKSNELTIKALPPDQAAAPSNQGNSNQQVSPSGSSTVSSEDVFVRMTASKNSVYENEGFLLTFKIYTLVNFSIENVKFPEFEGFISQEIELPNTRQYGLENVNGRNYRTLVLKQVILFPQHSGKITIGSGKYDIIAEIRSQQRQRSIFDSFLDMSIPVKKTIVSPSLSIDVKPLPSGKPASFSGAVGDYRMTSSISTNRLKSNDALTVKVNISGSGNIKLIKNPEIVFPNDFDPFDPVVNTDIKVTSGGVSGTKTIEYNAIPRFAGDFIIPSAEFSYFDIKTGSYKTLKTNEFNLHVEQGEAGKDGVAPIVNASNKQDVRFLGKDIRYIKTENYRFHQGVFFYGTLGHALFYIIPALLFIVLFIIYRKQAAENANIALVRTKKANKVASKRLKTAAKYLKENKNEAFYDEILKAVWGYLSDKLNIPVSALTKDNVETNLTQYGVDGSLIGEFMNILNTAEFARFAPAQGSGEMGELYSSTVQAIDKMENTIKK